MLLALIARIIIADDRIRVVLRADVFRSRTGIREGEDQAGQGDGLVLDLPVSFRRRGVETRLIIGEAGSVGTAPDPKLVKLLGQAQQWLAELRIERGLSLNALAERHGVDSGDISRILPLAFLAPDIAEAILDGRQPPELTAMRLKRINELPLSWARQRDLLGFT
jgi:hypothetical protein